MDTIRNQHISSLRSEIAGRASSPGDRLKAMISVFSSWSEDAEKQKIMREIAVKMDSQDINLLRTIIDEQVTKLKAKNTHDLTDQILFIIIGALKFEIKREAFSKHWQLAELSLNSVLSDSQKRRIGLFNSLLLASFLILITAIVFINNNKLQVAKTKKVDLVGNYYLDSTEPIPSPYVPSHFYSLRKEMGKSVCIIPQAATLPAEQRAAFLTFINTGEIELNQLTNLQAALSLVHCEYTPLTIRLKH